MGDQKPTVRRGSHGAEADAIETITQCIRDGRFAPGQRLSESFLTKEFGFSRNTIREALRSLSARGLITFETNKGARVVLLDRDDVAALYQMREVVEGLGASLAAANINFSGNRDQVTHLLEDIKALKASKDTKQFFGHNTILHTAIAEMSDNKYVLGSLDGLQIPALRASYFDDIPEETFLKSLQDHEDLLLSILDGDAVAAECQMREHVKGTRRSLLRLSDKEFRRIYQGGE